MLHRSAVRALALATLVASPAAAQTVIAPYAPVSAKYRATNVVSTEQSAMGQTMTFAITTKQLVSLALSGSAPTLDLSIKLDSLTSESDNPMVPVPDASSLLGTTFTGKVGVDGTKGAGKLTNAAGEETNNPIAAALNSFLPKIKVGAKAGDSWTDSSETNQLQNGGIVKATTVTQYTHAGDTTFAGVSAIKVTVSGNTKIEGTGNMQGSDFTVEGTGKTAGAYFLGRDGTLLGGDTTNDADITISVEAVGMVIPMKQSTKSKVEKVS
jgi:hypothetical protein